MSTKPRPCVLEWYDGAWHTATDTVDGPEPEAIVIYTDEPSPETGHVGWCWWARGKMGDAETREAACEAAEPHTRGA